MNISIKEKGVSKIAVVNSPDIIISDIQTALDLMATIRYTHGCEKMVVNKSNISEDFFNLRTGLAGEILQKYMNYKMKIAIVGNFDVYDSKSLKDFIYESNQGKWVFFLRSEQDALDTLHGIL